MTRPDGVDLIGMAGTRWVIDGMNVIGSRPTGWWRNLDGAICRFLEQLLEHAARTGDRLTVVFDHHPKDLAPGLHNGVEVRFPRRSGRDAGDDEIVRLVENERPEERARMHVVTSDRRLAERVESLAATVVSAGAFLRRLEDPTRT